MLTFKKFIEEHYVNLVGDHPDKHKYADEVWNLVQNSYAKIGGIKGSGFNSKEDMIKNVHFWKLKKRNGKVVAASFYKDKNGRKRVAGATDGTPEGKKEYAKVMGDELKRKRSYFEVSGPAFATLHKQFGDELHKHIVPRHEVGKYIDDKLHDPPKDDLMVQKYPQFAHHMYARELGGHKHVKIMLGKDFKKGK